MSRLLMQNKVFSLASSLNKKESETFNEKLRKYHTFNDKLRTYLNTHYNQQEFIWKEYTNMEYKCKTIYKQRQKDQENLLKKQKKDNRVIQTNNPLYDLLRICGNVPNTKNTYAEYCYGFGSDADYGENCPNFNQLPQYFKYGSDTIPLYMFNSVFLMKYVALLQINKIPIERHNVALLDNNETATVNSTIKIVQDNIQTIIDVFKNHDKLNDNQKSLCYYLILEMINELYNDKISETEWEANIIERINNQCGINAFEKFMNLDGFTATIDDIKACANELVNPIVDCMSLSKLIFRPINDTLLPIEDIKLFSATKLLKKSLKFIENITTNEEWHEIKLVDHPTKEIEKMALDDKTIAIFHDACLQIKSYTKVNVNSHETPSSEFEQR